MAAHPADIVNFWREAGPKQWYAKDAAFDEAIRLKFEPVHHAAARGEYDGWIETPEGALALVVLLDQFPRNLYRDSSHAFASDGLARMLADEAIARGHDQVIEPLMREFFYMPFVHSEDLALHDRAIELFRGLGRDRGDPEADKWALIHRAIVARFGRYPHRNRALGRATTPEEQAFLDGGGFSG